METLTGYFIVQIELENHIKNNRPAVRQCAGFVASKKRAIHIVETNESDIQSPCYDYILIEAIDSSLYPIYIEGDDTNTITERLWYKWNKEKHIYERCSCPDYYKNRSYPIAF